MVKIIRFPLIMENGIEVRSLAELKENFSLASVINYYENGKLMCWLRNNYEDDIADLIDALDPNAKDIPRKIAEIFSVPYDNTDYEKVSGDIEKIKRTEHLKQYTDDPRFLEAIDSVAFNQDELYNLLDEKKETVYICEGRFSIPLSKRGMTYIGIGNPNPTVIINSDTVVNWDEKDISFHDVTFDEKYLEIIKQAKVNNNEEIIDGKTNLEYEQEAADSNVQEVYEREMKVAIDAEQRKDFDFATQIYYKWAKVGYIDAQYRLRRLSLPEEGFDMSKSPYEDTIKQICKEFISSISSNNYGSGNGVLSREMRRTLKIPSDDEVYLAHDASYNQSCGYGFAIASSGMYTFGRTDVYGRHFVYHVTFQELVKADSIYLFDQYLIADNREKAVAYTSGTREDRIRLKDEVFQRIKDVLASAHIT